MGETKKNRQCISIFVYLSIYLSVIPRAKKIAAINSSRTEATESLTFDLSIISNWGRENLVVIITSKTQFLFLLTRHNLPTSIMAPTFSPSSTMNILGLSFTHNLNWKLHIPSLDKTVFMKLGVLRRLHQFFNSLNC